jgi:hypothetical protein
MGDSMAVRGGVYPESGLEDLTICHPLSHGSDFNSCILFTSTRLLKHFSDKHWSLHNQVYPHNITTGYFQKETGEIKFQIDSPVSTNYTLDVFAINPAGAAQTSVFSTTVHGNKYYQFSLDLSSIYIKNRDISLRVVIGNEYTSYIQLTVTRSYLPYALDFMFYSS